MDPRTAKMLADRQDAAALPPPPVKSGTSFTARLKAHWRFAALGAVALAVALPVARHMLITLPAIERSERALTLQAEQDAEERKAAETDVALTACLSSVDTDQAALWRAACQARKAKPGCPLPASVVVEHDKQRRDARNDCLRKYSLDVQ